MHLSEIQFMCYILFLLLLTSTMIFQIYFQTDHEPTVCNE